MFAPDDTIVAIATPPGRSGIGVVRVAGPEALRVASHVLTGGALEPRLASLRHIVDGAPVRGGGRHLDQVVATFFPRPASYTGEDTVEISAHGSPFVLERMLAVLVGAGARLARPGEFTLRAYANGKIDLVQAEAVGDLIEAVTPAQVRLAVDQLDGTLTQAIGDIAGALFDVRVRLEASIDFPEEGYHFVEPDAVVAEIDAVSARVARLLGRAGAGRVIREGRRVVFVGAPNVGKSSLFNAFLGTSRAIVTPVAGTTRDLLTERCDVGGVPLTLVDTAGLRDSDELVEREGVSRSRGAAGGAGLLVFVLDRSRPIAADERAELEALAPDVPRVIAVNKCDLTAAWTADSLGSAAGLHIEVSATTGSGLEHLRAAMLDLLLGGEPLNDEIGVSNVRHVALLERAQSLLAEVRGLAAAKQPEELLLAGLQGIDAALGEIVGSRSTDDVLASIFERFCIGK